MNKITFEDLKFTHRPSGLQGTDAKIFFENGYGASVITGEGVYAKAGEYELAVLKGTSDDWDLCYDATISSDVIGYLSESEVVETLNRIASL